MIVNIYVVADLAIAFFALAVGAYAAYKAYKVGEAEKSAESDKRYESEKDFYLVSTVGWMTLGARVLAIPLFFITVLSLIPAVPGAMCEFGVFQAGAPYSWAALGIKLITMFVFAGWLFMEFVNRKSKSAPMMRSLARWFVLLVPLLFVDAILDIAFFGSLEPLVVPCCMVIYSNAASTPFGIGCPFCYVTYQMPLFMGVIPAYAVSVALILWSFVFKRSSRGLDIQPASHRVISKAIIASIFLAVIGTILLIVQMILGPSAI